MAASSRLTGLDASFLHLEQSGNAHMHVAGVYVFDGPPPPYEEFVEALDRRLDLVPRYRQRLAWVPLGQGRPRWVDDPYFNVHYHVRHTALPAPGNEDTLSELAGRLMAQELDRTKPLWEIWLVEGLEGGRFALIGKTHHALVDGISGVDIATVLFDTSRDPSPVGGPADPWTPRPLPTDAQLLGEALLQRATMPAEIARGVRALFRAPRRAATAARDGLVGVGALAWAGLNPAPETRLNVRIGPHRQYKWVDADLAQFKAIKNALGGTINDVVLSAVTLALGRYLRRHGDDTRGLVLKAMVPVSVRADIERGALGNRVAAMWAPLPVGIEDPGGVFAEVHQAMQELKASGQAVGAQVLTSLTGFAPPTLMSQAARLQSRQRFFNLVVTNVPGPQFKLYLLGRELLAMYPVVPLAEGQALGIAIMSYAGSLGFGLLSDGDALTDLDDLAEDLREAIDELAWAAGADHEPTPPRRTTRQRPTTTA
jgi:WS/DGAT/MGAT family acyltransferase